MTVYLLDSNTFWKCLENKLGMSNSSPTHVVNGNTDNALLAESFADYFSRVCTPNCAVQNTKLYNIFVCRFEHYVGADMAVDVNLQTVHEIISKLRPGKAPSGDGIMNEHLLYCDRIISLILARLYKAMLCHSYVPQSFGLGIVIPLLKGINLDKSHMDNYRAITLSPTTAKVFESYCCSRCKIFCIHLNYNLVLRKVLDAAML